MALVGSGRAMYAWVGRDGRMIIEDTEARVAADLWADPEKGRPRFYQVNQTTGKLFEVLLVAGTLDPRWERKRL